jgi:hypothetical protein
MTGGAMEVAAGGVGHHHLGTAMGEEHYHHHPHTGMTGVEGAVVEKIGTGM